MIESASRLTLLRSGAGDAQAVTFAPPSPTGRGVGGEVFSRGAGMTQRARALRNAMTDAERRLWTGLRGDRLGVRFRRQLTIQGRYIADFCAPAIGLIVEVDGSQHADAPPDAVRTAFLESQGYRVMRFWNNDVLNALDSVLDAVHMRVQDLAAAKTSPLAPLRGGEGDALTTMPKMRQAETVSAPNDLPKDSC